jgi:hypothetical protein
MRLICHAENGAPTFAVRLGEEAVSVAALAGAPADLAGLLAADASALQSQAVEAPPSARRPVASLHLLPPVPHPGKVICIGLNYALHAKEGGNPIPDYPAVFLRVGTSFVAPGQPLRVPAASAKLDWEAELAVVIGRRASASRRNGRWARTSTPPAASAPNSSPPTSCRRVRRRCASAPASTASACRTARPAT